MKRNVIIFALLSIFVISGCLREDAPSPKQVYTPLDLGSYEDITFDPTSQVNTKQFKSMEEYSSFVKSYRSSGDSYMYFDRAIGGAMLESSMDAMAIGVAVPQAKASFSETNNQVQGVDEGDIIKTDGDYIYTVSDNTLFIIKAYPGEDAEIVFSEKLKSRPEGLFINDDKLVVFGNFNDLDFFKEIDFRPKYGMTFFSIYDISDKSSPELVKEYKFEGNYFNSRMHGDYVYFVVRTTPEYRTIMPTPIIVEGTVKRGMPVSDIYYYDIPYRNPQFVTVHSIDLDDFSNVNSAAVSVEYNQNMYMSENNIYITYTEQINEYELQQEITQELMHEYLTEADKQLIEKVKVTDDEVLSRNEKKNKIMQIYYTYLNYLDNDEQEALTDRAEELLMERLKKYEYLEFTVVNKISVDDGKIRVEDNGEVPGHVINQFSMDEYKGNLRIATTISARWSRFGKERTHSTNNIYVLDGDMDIIGRLVDLAENEQIYSTRFMGERLYMVTFRQVDPFFVIDLSNPANPKELGKLKIPGFSRYLHPYDEDTIIGVGQDATETGRVKGLKISLFDVSDVENPKEIAKFVTDERYAQSTALYEHKAFLFSREKELLVIPAYSYEWNSRSGGDDSYNGAFVFRITKDEIELRGLIDHSKAGSSRYYYSPLVERSLWINELLYTKSPNLLRINEIDDLSSVKDISLEHTDSRIKIF